ncbi:MAG: DNA-directed RNA polymerase subunit beta [Aerococcus sp.]|nr:DNA-directed RNA polymerase subunit beta [Aerococcus sp.]
MENHALGKRLLHLLGRLLLVIAVFIVIFAIGLMVGYGVSGDGPFWSIFSPDKWQHLFSFFPW